ncbi:MAG: hydantoinase/oxoprolinase family protein [Pseudomonadota bacterium]
MQSGLYVAFDIGGTFTDVVIAGPNSALSTFKILTIPQSVGRDVNACIVEAQASTSPTGGVTQITHGTTVASNAVLENTRARTGLITTHGFRDDLEIRRQARPSVYDVFWERTEPLIPRRLRREVTERIRVDGTVETPLDAAELLHAIDRLRDQDVEAVAICFLHAYLNASHERAARDAVTAALPDISVCVSSDVLGEMREYERASTTALNASLMPVVARYLDQIDDQLAEHGREIYIMQSNGGVMRAGDARQRPVQMIESGPAAGVLAAAALAREIDLSQAVAFDMGGTTAKACLIENGQPVETAEGEVGAGINLASRLSSGAGYAVRVPAYDIAEVGAGGGSIAWIDDGRALRVGPRSAGAEPGPAAYGRGGREPTITDANIALGYMNPARIAGGRVAIEANKASEAINRELAEPLGLSLAETAHGIHRVANSTMSRAIRAVTTERGRDPRDFALIAFGGAGAIHAAQMAQDLSMRTLVIPPHPGLFSALGLLMADIRRDAVQSLAGEAINATHIESLFESFSRLEDSITASAAGTHESYQFTHYLDLRYARQSSELTVQVPDDLKRNQFADHMIARFHAAHEQTYGYARPEEVVQLAGLRVKGIAPGSRLGFADLTPPTKLTETNTTPVFRDAYFGAQHGMQPTRIVTRDDLRRESHPGPLIVEEFDTTVVIPPGARAHTDDMGNIWVDLSG